MNAEETHLNKVREIAFCPLHPDTNQARSAAAVLLMTEGINDIQIITPHLLKVHYHVLAIRLADIEKILSENGLHLDNRLIYKIKRALYSYCEDTLVANAKTGLNERNFTRKVFVNNYQKHCHGCQDQRPEHWRKYL